MYGVLLLGLFLCIHESKQLGVGHFCNIGYLMLLNCAMYKS